MNYWTDNEHRDHKQATNKKPYTNNRYSFHDKQVEIACESMESLIARRTEAKILLAIASRSICVDCLVIGRQVSQYRRAKHSLWLNKRYIWNRKTKIVKRSTHQRYRSSRRRNTSLSNVSQLSRPFRTDITCVRKLDNIVWSDASCDIWNFPPTITMP